MSGDDEPRTAAAKGGGAAADSTGGSPAGTAPADAPRSPVKRDADPASRDVDYDLTTAERRGLALLALLVTSLLLAAAVVTVYLEGDDDDTSPASTAELRVDGVMPLFKQSSGNNTNDFEMLVMMTNSAETPAENVCIDIAGIDNLDKLTYDKANASDLTIVRSDTIHINLTVPAVPQYKLFVTVFIDEKLMLKGYLIVLPAGGSAKRDWQLTYDRTGLDRNQGLGIKSSNDDDGRSASTSFLMLLFIFMLAIEVLVVLGTLRWKAVGAALTKCTARAQNWAGDRGG